MIEPKNIITVQFREHPITDYTKTEPEEIDISSLGTDFAPDFITENKFNLQAYCFCLVNKLKVLNNSKFEDFLNHQCQLVKDPMTWINRFEKLIAENVDCCDSKKWKASVIKINNLIELKRKDLKGKNNSKDHSKMNEQHNEEYSFRNLKKNIAGISIDQQKIKLIEAKANYLQNKPLLINSYETPFDNAIDIEIEKIDLIEKLQKGKSQTAKVPVPVASEKGQINGAVNLFVEVFYQMMNKKLKNDLPFLKISKSALCEILANNFLDKDGEPLNNSTVDTILSPNKPEKRPKLGKAFKLKLEE